MIYIFRIAERYTYIFQVAGLLQDYICKLLSKLEEIAAALPLHVSAPLQGWLLTIALVNELVAPFLLLGTDIATTIITSP